MKKYDEYHCEFKNEAECEEEVENAGEDYEEVLKEKFE
jgi:hypothetical protein